MSGRISPLVIKLINRSTNINLRVRNFSLGEGKTDVIGFSLFD